MLNNLTIQSDTKQKIFSEAAKLFSEKGYHGVSMREISERAGVTKPTIYYYFGNKEGIYKSLVETAIQYGDENVQGILDRNIPVKNKLVELIKNRFQISLKYPEFAKFFLKVMYTTDSLSFHENFKFQAKRHKQTFSSVIKEGVESGEFGAGAQPDLAVEIIGAVLSHFVRRQLYSKKSILSDKLAEEIVELLFKGLNE